jgi:hypothetical protein
VLVWGDHNMACLHSIRTEKLQLRVSVPKDRKRGRSLQGSAQTYIVIWKPVPRTLMCSCLVISASSSTAVNRT